MRKECDGDVEWRCSLGAEGDRLAFWCSKRAYEEVDVARQ
jgi:hypothetical protein